MKQGLFRITRAAERDLVGIGRYTNDRWGADQCERYLRQLDARFSALAADPATGRPCDEVRKGFRQFHEGKHVIFYRVSKQGTVEIIRVLHERMLPDLHF